MAWYRIGTVGVTNGSQAVTGAGTDWLALTGVAQVSNSFIGPDGRLYEVGSIAAAGLLQLVEPYAGPTLAGQPYAIMPTMGLTAELARQVGLLVQQTAEAIAAGSDASAILTQIQLLQQQVDLDSNAAMGFRNEANNARDQANEARAAAVPAAATALQAAEVAVPAAAQAIEARDQALAGGRARASVAAALADATIAAGQSFTAPLPGGSFQTYLKVSEAVATPIGEPFVTQSSINAVTVAFSPRDTSRSGWVASMFDRDNRRFSGIELATKIEHRWLERTFHATVRMSGDLVPTTLVAGSTRVAYKTLTTRTGMIWAKYDSHGKRFFWQATDGTLWSWGKRVLNSDDYSALAAQMGIFQTVRYASTRIGYSVVSPRSGMIWAKFDSTGKRFFWQGTDGAVWAWGKRLLNSDDYAALAAQMGVFQTAKYAATRISYATASPRSGMIWAKFDNTGKRFFWQATDGTLWSWGKRLLNTDDLAGITVPAPVYAVFQAVDPAGKQQIFARTIVSSAVRQLSASGSNNTAPRLTEDGQYVMYATDRTTGLLAGQIAVPLAGGAERLVTPRRAMTAAGDSGTAAQGATNPATEGGAPILCAAMGWTLTNRAIGGFTSTSIAGLLGAIPNPTTVDGNSIVGNGATTSVTAITTKPLSQHNGSATDGATREITGTLAGVHGTLRKVPAGAYGSYTDVYTFKSDVGAATTACPAGSNFVPDAPDQDNGKLWICLGTNRDGETDATIRANVAAIMAWSKPLYPQIFLFGLWGSSSSLNGYWRETYPKYYVIDSLGRDLHQRLLASGNGSADDNADIAADRVPRSLLADWTTDLTHLGTPGYAIWGALAIEFSTARGWNLL